MRPSALSPLAPLLLAALCLPLLASCSGGGGSGGSAAPPTQPKLEIQPGGTLAEATVGSPYSVTFATPMGTPPHTFRVAAGTLPAGLTLDGATGRLQGSPTRVERCEFTVAVADSSTPARTGDMRCALAVKAATPGLSLSPTGALAEAAAAWPYWTRLTANGGTAPYRYALTSGSLPAGLRLDPDTGEIQGTPTAAGPASFTVQATDAATPPLTGQAPCTLSVGPAWSTAKPAVPRNTFFIHHSVGANLYARGPLKAELYLNNFITHNLPENKALDMTYNEGVVAGPPRYVIGDHTDPHHWPVNFNTPAYFQVMYTWHLPTGQHHDVMMFKSCYPASGIQSEQMLEDYKSYYRSLLPTFRLYPGTLFVPFTTPPLNPAATTAAEGARARRFAHWLQYEYAAQLTNVQAFDLFDVLANDPNHATEPNMLKAAYRSGTDSHPTAAGDKAVTAAFIPWISAAVRAAGMEK